MSTDKEKLNELVSKMEELTIKLAKVAEELKSVSTSMKTLSTGQVNQSSSQPAQTVQAPNPPPTGQKLRTLDEIRMSFPEELESLLGFEEKGDYIIIKVDGVPRLRKIRENRFCRQRDGRRIHQRRERITFQSTKEKSVNQESASSRLRQLIGNPEI